MNKNFYKMHGLGNDFVIIDNRADDAVPDVPLRRAIANRKYGVGCDQLIILTKAKDTKADLFMHIFNPDGSDGGACGNATRCVARLLFEETGKTECLIQTGAGFLPVHTAAEGMISVDFGEPKLQWQDIPLAHEANTLSVDLVLDGLSNPCCVNVGNPHAVFFVEDAEAVPLSIIGPKLETHPLFPACCNIEVAHIINRNHIRMRVWERGAGITQACGSGACATIIAAIRRGLTDRRAIITMDGGDLILEWREDGRVIMTGTTAKVFEGKFDDRFLV